MTKLFLFFLLMLIAIATPMFACGQVVSHQWIEENTASGTGELLDVHLSSDGVSAYGGGHISNSSLPVFGIPILAVSKGTDAVLVKYSTSGVLQWSVSFGGTGNDEIIAVKEKANGNILVGGNFTGSIVVTGTGINTVSLTSAGGTDMLFAEYNPLGDLITAFSGGGTGDDIIKDLQIIGNAALFCGSFSSPTYTLNLMTLANASGGQDAIGGRFNNVGVTQWLTGGSSTGTSSFEGVARIGGSAFFGGYFSGTNFLTTNGLISAANASTGNREGVLMKCSYSGGAATNLITLSGTGDDEILAVEEFDYNLYVAGKGVGAVSLGVSSAIASPYSEAIIGKIDTNLVPGWLKNTAHTANGYAGAYELDVLPSGRILAIGEFSGAMSFAGSSLTSYGGQDGIVLGIDTSGIELSFDHVGGSGDDVIHGVNGISESRVAFAGRYRGNSIFSPLSATGVSSGQPFVSMALIDQDTVTISGTDSICSGGSADLTFTFTGVGPYDITIYDGTTSTDINNIASSPYTYSVSPTSNTTYTLTAFSSPNGNGIILGNAVINVVSSISNNVIGNDTTICSGQTPSFVGSVPSGGSGFTYLWQYRTGVLWNDGNNTNNLQNYVSVPINQNVEYRRRVFVSGCPTSTSNVVTATIVPNISNNSIAGDQQSCGSFDPTAFSASVPSGGTGSYSYIWEEDTDSSFLSPTTVGTGSTYDPSSISQDFYYRRIIHSISCADTSNFVIVEVDSEIADNTINGDETICGPGTPSPFTSTPATGGDGLYSYLWQSSPDEVVWSDIATSESYSAGSLSVTTYYRRIVNSGFCADTSDKILITVHSLISNNSISASGDITICEGTAPSSIIGTAPAGGDNSNYTFLWETSPDNIVWSTATGVNNTSDYIPAVQFADRYYRRTVSSGVCPSSVSNIIQIAVYPPISNNSIFTSQTICANTAPTLLTGTTPTGGSTGPYVYNWQASTDNINFTVLAGTNSINYQPGLLTSTTYYRRRVNRGTCGSNFSDTITITVEPALTNNSISADQTLCGPSLATPLDGSNATGGSGSMIYTWFSSTDSLTWTNVSSTEDYSPGTVSQTTYYFRTVVSGACSVQDTSNVITITIQAALANNSISAAQTLCGPSIAVTLDGSVATGGNGSMNYTWYSSIDNITFSSVGSAEDYSPGLVSQTTYYFRTVTSGACTMEDTSNVLTITVQPELTNNTITSDQLLCGTNSVAGLNGTFASGGSGTMSYGWYESIDSLIWTNVASTQNYDPLSVSQTTFYFRTVTSGACSSEDTSNVVTITYEPSIINNTISSDQNVCIAEQPDTIIGQTATTTAGSIDYSWVQSTDFSTWSVAFGVFFGTDFVPSPVTDTTWYRRIAKAGLCPEDTSNIVILFVEDSIANNALTPPAQICSNDLSGVINGSLPTQGDGSYTYEWEKSNNDTLWSPIGSSNVQNLSIGGISTDTYFRRIVTSGECGSDTSASVLQQVSPYITSNNIGNSQTICYDSIPALLFGAVQTPGTFGFSWQQSTDSTTFLIASGTFDNASYQAANLTETTFYRRVMKSGACPNDTSNIVKIEVLDTLTNNTISSDSIVCFGTSGIDLPGSIPTGGDGNYMYAWESSIDAVNYSPASGSGGSTSAGFTTGTLTQTTYFRRIVYSAPCSLDSTISNVVTITVQAALSANTITSDQVLCGDYTVSTLDGSMVSGGSGIPTYQWQSSGDLISWNDEVTTEDYSPGVISDTMYYRRKVTSGACTADNISDTVTVIYLPIVFLNSIQANDTICSGDSPATITDVLFPPSGGDGSYSFIWEQSNDSTNWSPALGTPSGTSFDADPLTDTTFFRRIVGSNVCPTDTSNSLIVVVEDSVDNNIISIPGDVCSSNITDSIFATVPIGGTSIYTYQWEIYDSLLPGWVNAPGTSNNQEYALGTISDSAYFRRIVTSGQCGSDTSNSLLVAVQPAINTNTISNDQTICFSTAPAILTGTTPTGSGFVYIWEESTDNVTFTTAIGGLFQPDYQPGSLTTTSYYKRIINSGVCDADTSNTLTVTVYDALAGNTIANDTSVCYNQSQLNILGSTPTGGSGNFNYLWEVSNDGVNFATPSVNFTSTDYSTGTLTQSTYYRRRVTDANCPNDTLFSNIMLVTVFSEITHSYLADIDTVCEGLDANVLFQITGDSPFSIAYNFNNGPIINASSISNAGYNLSFTPTTSGILILDTVYDAHGCFINPIDTFTYRVVAYPVVSLDEDTTVCEDVIFNASHGNGILSFTSPTLGNLSTTFPLNYTSTSYGMHEFILSEDIEGCVDTDTINVTFTESVSNISAGFDTELFLTDSIYLDATDLLPNETGVWSLISGGGAFADTTDPQTLFTDIISGITVLEWTVSNGVCPSKSVEVALTVENLIVPTGFSPNGDGDNDVLEFAGRDDIPTIRIQIYDRWGGIVFEDSDYQNDWSGTNSIGEALPEDTYFMIVDLGDKGITKSYLVIRR